MNFGPSFCLPVSALICCLLKFFQSIGKDKILKDIHQKFKRLLESTTDGTANLSWYDTSKSSELMLIQTKKEGKASMKSNPILAAYELIELAVHAAYVKNAIHRGR